MSESMELKAGTLLELLTAALPDAGLDYERAGPQHRFLIAFEGRDHVIPLSDRWFAGADRPIPRAGCANHSDAPARHRRSVRERLGKLRASLSLQSQTATRMLQGDCSSSETPTELFHQRAAKDLCRLCPTTIRFAGSSAAIRTISCVGSP